MALAVVFAAGAIFGVGLVVGGMVDPDKVMAFLDFGGEWDPSLAFVMVGAIVVHLVTMPLVLKRKAPLFDTVFHVPTRRDIDGRLVGGAALFGVGWGLGGFCPGPGVVSIGSGSVSAVAFVVAMLLGMVVAGQLIGSVAKSE